MTKIGGLCYKFVSPNHKGVPDRICVFPPFTQGAPGPVWWIECKSTGQKLSALQKLELERLAKHGQLAAIVDSKGGVDSLINKYKEIKDALLREAERNKINQESQEERRIIIPGRR